MRRKRRMFFKAAQRDKAEPDIIDALRKVGATVWQVSGKDIPDLLVGYKGQTFLLEVKTRGLEYTDKRNGRTYKRDGALRDGQKEFFASWTGGPAREVFTPEEALMAVGAPVEGVLEPLPPAASASTIAARLNANPNRTHDHIATGNYIITQPLKTAPHVVTPEFRREQTKAVVPRRRKKT